MKKLSFLLLLALAGCSGKDESGSAAAPAGGTSPVEASPAGSVSTREALPRGCPEIRGTFANEAAELFVDTKKDDEGVSYRLARNGAWMLADGQSRTAASSELRVSCSEGAVEFVTVRRGQSSVLKLALLGPDQLAASSEGSSLVLSRKQTE